MRFLLGHLPGSSRQTKHEHLAVLEASKHFRRIEIPFSRNVEANQSPSKQLPLDSLCQ